jgi:hypothetical protein
MTAVGPGGDVYGVWGGDAGAAMLQARSISQHLSVRLGAGMLGRLVEDCPAGWEDALEPPALAALAERVGPTLPHRDSITKRHDQMR